MTELTPELRLIVAYADHARRLRHFISQSRDTALRVVADDEYRGFLLENETILQQVTMMLPRNENVQAH